MLLCDTQMRLEIVTSFNVQSLVPTTHVILLKRCPVFSLTWWDCILPSCFMEPSLSKSEKKTHFAVPPYILLLPYSWLLVPDMTIHGAGISISSQCHLILCPFRTHPLAFFPSFPTVAPTWPACPRYYLSLWEQHISPWESPVSLTFLLNIFILKDAKII